MLWPPQPFLRFSLKNAYFPSSFLPHPTLSLMTAFARMKIPYARTLYLHSTCSVPSSTFPFPFLPSQPSPTPNSPPWLSSSVQPHLHFILSPPTSSNVHNPSLLALGKIPASICRLHQNHLAFMLSVPSPAIFLAQLTCPCQMSCTSLPRLSELILGLGILTPHLGATDGLPSDSHIFCCSRFVLLGNIRRVVIHLHNSCGKAGSCLAELM